MLRIGLTGGIAAGKSTVTGWLAERGAVVVDADDIAREVVEPGTEGLRALVQEFGDRILTDDTTVPGRRVLDRAGLARVAFADAGARARLEAVTHPLIADRTQEIVAAVEPDRIVVHAVPLLVEKAMGDAYHLVVVVHAEEAERVARLVRYRGMQEGEAWARIEAQADDAARRAAADVTLDSGFSGAGLERLQAQVASLWQDRLLPFEANLQDRVRAARGPAHVVPPDPNWPDAARRLIGRIRRMIDAAGVADATVDHIGSTAVPGLPAKDVIDLMVGVRDLAQADALRPALERAGFVLVPGITRDNPHPVMDGGAEEWQKRFHANCDPGRPVNLHVRVRGSAGFRTVLLVRDWLRSVADARQEYAALKLELAAVDRSENDYAEAKEPWMAGAVPRAAAWAASRTT